MGTTGDAADVIIILSDDEEEDISCSDLSVLIVEVEDVKKSDCAVPPGALDEDLVITFSRSAEVLPHARYDCPIHAFTPTDSEIGVSVAGNHLTCDQCFCYICDKLASSCKLWSYSGVCHCNSHKRSDFWNNLRNSLLLGGLKTFNLTLSEIDSHLRHADTMLQSFRQGLSEKFLSTVKTPEKWGLNRWNQKSLIFDYTPVYEFVSSFLNRADQQEGRAAAVMRLGAAAEFIRHFQISGYFISQSLIANAVDARLVLLQRVIALIQKQMVMTDLTPEFIDKLQDFSKRLFLPAELKSLKNSLCVRHWEDVLLVTVLKGQNVTGVRKDKGKRDQLIEQISVVLLRTELLQRQHRYRELCRYLRVVKTDDSKLLQSLRDLIPFFTCMDGSLTGSLDSFFPSVNAPASRLTPHLFLFYFRVFDTATAPTSPVSQSAHLGFSGAWQPIKDAVPLPRALLVRFALRVQRCCAAVFNDSCCWTILLKVVNTLTAVPEPRPEFLHEAKDVVNSILLGQHGSNLQIPTVFQEVYPDQALLLLVTGALDVRILSAALSPALPVLNTFKENIWALGWLWDNLSTCPERLRSFLQEISREMEITKDGDHLLPFLHAALSTSSSSTEDFDQPSRPF
ncbi:uncharacterized protein zgc:112980 isoform X2 [Cyclopterus lumpus]|uniref:Zgc:112980 n=1 Tax=Cyclopterus lumpus TaxID=8103 RepID=A0A8C2WE86_CYCLU|nr:uncharacterized protein zgc:112980 isoform X2 [Cyclopterus lumpus]XP_034398878.1 uncharacterized protein zgc:112980 isoform X2 [Cyclopterus lumpus]